MIYDFILVLKGICRIAGPLALMWGLQTAQIML